MTDQQIHERLAAAGERWRAVQPADVPEPRIDLQRVRVFRRPTAWLVSVAAVAAGVIALVLALATDGGTAPRPIPAMNPSSIEDVRWVDPSIDYTWPPGVHERPGSYRRSYKRSDWLRIAANGRVTGFDGCAAFAGRARVTGSYIYFGQLMKDLVRRCTNPGRRREAILIDAFLTGRVRWQLVCGQLRLIEPSRGDAMWSNSSIPDFGRALEARASCMHRWSRAHS